jgi:diaminohydroxyphosphoribosylaminopyrimidine deaminase/5-amino-6-(5-phosphoribosylamino)uracil reductase
MIRPTQAASTDLPYLRLALRLARRGYGRTSPNPMVGALLVKSGRIIGQGWHRRAGEPHAEAEAIGDAHKRGNNPDGATLYVTLEPCSTHGRTPPCTDAIKTAGIKRVVVGAMDPNPRHRGKAFKILKRAGIAVTRLGGAPFGAPRPRGRDDARHPGRVKSELQTKLSDDCTRLNEAFNHWIVQRTPFVIVKAAMTLDGKIATASGESKWITGAKARAYAMRLREGADAIMVGVNTVLADDPGLTFRKQKTERGTRNAKFLRRIILDTRARTPLNARIVSDGQPELTTIVVGTSAPKRRVAALARRVKVVVAPPTRSESGNLKTRIDPRWLLEKLGAENVTSLLVEGGGEVNASFLLGGFAHRVAFFYAPKILGGRDAPKAVAGNGAERLREIIQLRRPEWRRLGPDLLLTARVNPDVA